MEKFILPPDAKLIIADMIKESDLKKDRIALLVEKSGASQDVKDAFLSVIKGDSAMTIEEALKVEGMKDYIENVKAEAKKELEDEISQLKEQVKQLEDIQKELNETKEQLQDQVQKNEGLEKNLENYRKELIDAIVLMAKATRHSAIDVEDVEGSAKKFAEELQDKELDALKETFDSMRKEVIEKLINVPKDGAEDPLHKTDPVNDDNPGKNEDPEDKDTKVEIEDLGSLIGFLFKK